MDGPQYAVVALGLASLLYDWSVSKRLAGDPKLDEGTCMVLVVSLTANMMLGWLFTLVPLGRVDSGRLAVQASGLGIALTGLAVRYGAVWQLGRQFTWQLTRAAPGVVGGARLVTAGLYRYVRHPSYIGGLLAGGGMLLALGNLVPVAVFAVVHSVAVARRIRVEERHLRMQHGAAFAAYAAHTGGLFPLPALGRSVARVLGPWSRRANDSIARAMGLPALPAGVPCVESLPMLGNMRERLADPAGLVARVRAECGDVAAFRAGPVAVVLLHHPRELERYLQTPVGQGGAQGPLVRGLGFEVLKPVLGEGLFTCPDALWRPQRRLAQASLQTKHLDSSVPLWEETVRSWRAPVARRASLVAGTGPRSAPADPAPAPVVVDFKREASLLALEAYFRSQLGMHVPEAYPIIADATETLKDNAHERLHAWVFRQEWWPTRSNVRLWRHARALRRVARNVVMIFGKERPQRCTFLGTHLAALAQGGEAVPHAARLEEQLITFLLTGHETLAATLCFALQELAFHPEAQERVRAEARAAPGPLVAAALTGPGAFPYLDAVVREALRLYPAAWLMSKQATAEVEFGGHSFPAGTVFAAVPYAVHRDPRFWSEPESFRPERFLDGSPEPSEKFAWFPFGAGPRSCVGGAFATLELKVLLLRLVEAWTFEPVEPAPVPPAFSITLKPMAPVPLRCTPLAGSAAFPEELPA